MLKQKRWLVLSVSIGITIGVVALFITYVYRTVTVGQEIQTQYVYVLPEKTERRARIDVRYPAPITHTSAASTSTNETHIEDFSTQKAISQQTNTPERETMHFAESENGFKESHDSSSEYKDFLAEHQAVVADLEKYQSEVDAILSQIPDFVARLNSLSADEQDKFFEDLKALAQDITRQAGLEDGDRLNDVMADFLDMLIESGFDY